MKELPTGKYIANFLNRPFGGTDNQVSNVTRASKISDNTLSFITKSSMRENPQANATLIVPNSFIYPPKSTNGYIFSENPRLDFILAVRKFFPQPHNTYIKNTAIIGQGCNIDPSVSIGEYSVIKDNVIIGKNSVINNHVIIESETIIGSHCYIKSGSIIGEEGFGFERDVHQTPIRFPHLGNVEIGNNVEIGAKVTIARGALSPTKIKDNVKIDDQVHIGHNSYLGKNTMIAAASEISGSVYISKNCWIGPKVSIINGITIGESSFIGIGSTVTKSLLPNTKVGTIGNLSLRNIATLKKIMS